MLFYSKATSVIIGCAISKGGSFSKIREGKNLTLKNGGVDGCDCKETLKLIVEGKLDIEPLITHTYPLSKIDEAYELFENKRDGVIMKKSEFILPS